MIVYFVSVDGGTLFGLICVPFDTDHLSSSQPAYSG